MLSAVLGVWGMTIQYNRLFNVSSAWLTHTITVIGEGQRALVNWHNYETGKDDLQGVERQVQSLGSLTADNPAQQARTDSLRRILAGMTGVSPLRSGSVVQPTAGQGVRDLLLRMEDEEYRLLIGREAAFARSHQQLRDSILTLLILVFSLLCISIFLILYNFNRRKRTERVLAESEQRFDELVKQIREYSIIRLDPTGIVLTWNKGGEQIEGYVDQEIVGRHFSVFYAEEEKLREEPAMNLQQASEMGRLETTGRRQRKDGSIFHAHVVLSAIRNSAGRLTGFIKITQNIDAEVERQKETAEALTRERELNQMKSGFVALASHEFKTPLSVILSSANLIEKYSDPAMADKRTRHFRRIRANVSNLKNLLNDFLSLEKLEQGTIRNNPAAADLCRICAELVQDMEDALKEQQRIEFSIVGEARPVWIDENLLRNILINLLSNAVKYSPELSVIRLTLEFDDGAVRVLVADEGIGIPADEQVHLFERFFRATNTAGISGTGLGLSIVKKYLDLMKGSIGVESSNGRGATFTVTLPA